MHFDLLIVAFGMFEDPVFQIPEFFFQTVHLGEEAISFGRLVIQDILNLLVLAFLFQTAFIGGDAVAF